MGLTTSAKGAVRAAEGVVESVLLDPREEEADETSIEELLTKLISTRVGKEADKLQLLT